jgi:UDP-GlcNAc:undecaprenyl-phosphate/decaprenyl-phosphate GlcNAc-1-phosphate transferase
MTQFSLPLLLGVGLSLALTPISRRLALWVGAIDKPGARRIHTVATPRFGGPAIFMALVVASLLAAWFDPAVGAILRLEARRLVLLTIAASMILLVGVVDDIQPLKPVPKLLVEMTAAAFVVFGGYRIEAVWFYHLGLWSMPVTMVFIVAAVNAINLVDGLDGLAVGLCLIISTTLLLMCTSRGQGETPLMLAALCGVLLGFLPYNFNPARIFLGDSGALLLGFMVSIGTISAAHQMIGSGVTLAPFIVLGVPLAELVLTATRRILREVKVKQLRGAEARYRWFFLRWPALFTADRDHIHHRLLISGFTHRGVVLLLYLVCAICCASALAISYRPAMRTTLLAGLAVAGILGLRKLEYPELMLLKTGLLLPLLGSSSVSRPNAASGASLGDPIELPAQMLQSREPEQRSI